MAWGRNPGRGRPHARVALETPHGRAGVGEWSPPAPAHHTTHFLPAPSPETVNLRRQTRRAKGQDGRPRSDWRPDRGTTAITETTASHGRRTTGRNNP